MPTNRREFLCNMTMARATASIAAGYATNNTPPPNILWINTEDINPALGCYGDAYADTPNLDRLAARGNMYSQAFAPAPICAPTRSCLITGMYATTLGTQHLRFDIPIPDSIKCIPPIIMIRKTWREQ